MAETPNEAVNRLKKIVAEEVDQHKVEDVDLEDVSGGVVWSISYTTDPPPTPDQN
jgi:hypothetical protein